jgi:superfamily II RNA helicase
VWSCTDYYIDRSLPIKEKKLHDLEEKVKQEMAVQGEEIVEEYYLLREQLQKLKRVFTDTMNQPIYCLPFLQPGRLVRVTEGKNEWGWGVVVNFQVRAHRMNTHTTARGWQEMTTVLMWALQSTEKGGSR